MSRLVSNQSNLNLTSMTDKKKCSLCMNDYGLLYKSIEKESIRASNKKLDLKTNLQIDSIKFSPIYSYKLPCSHNICNNCFDQHFSSSEQNSFGFNCPICNKHLGRLNKKTSTYLIDFEHFGRACFNSLINKQFKLNNDLISMRTVYNNEKNNGYIREDIEKFIVKCGHCAERLAGKNTNLSDSIAEVFCISCYSVYCKECFTFKHNDTDMHGQLEIGKLSINTVLCMNHRIAFLGYCNDCKVLVCSSCMIKDHKGHLRSEIYEQIEKQKFFEDWIEKLKTIRKINSENLSNITEGYNNIVPKDLPNGLVDRYLYENNLVETATQLNFNMSLIQQANFIANVLINILTEYSMIPNHILFKRLHNNTETRIRKILEDYYSLLSFEEYEPIEQIEPLSPILNVENLKEIDVLIDTNNNINMRTEEENRIKSLSKSRSFLDSKLNVFSSKINKSSKLKEFIVEHLSDNKQIKENKKEEPGSQCLENDSNTISKKTDSSLIGQATNSISISSKDSFEPETLSTEKSYSVKLLAFVNPSLFYIRLASREQNKNYVENQMNKIYSNNDETKYLTDDDEISIGDNVAYEFEATTFKTWSRAKIIDLSTNLRNEKEATIFCYDWGLELSGVPINMLKRHNESLVDEPALAIKCFLHNIKPFSFLHSKTRLTKENSNDSIKDQESRSEWFGCIWRHVFDWTKKRTLTLKVLSKIEPDYYGVDLIDKVGEEMQSNNLTRSIAITYCIDTTHLSEMLVRCRMCQFEKEPINFKLNRICFNDIPRFVCMRPLIVNEKITANISNVQNLNEFFLRRIYPEYGESSFANLDAKLQVEYSSEKSELYRVYEPYVGMPVAALFEGDNRWYRAEISHVHSNCGFVTVYYVDFGNKNRISMESIRYLKNDFFKDEVTVYYFVIRLILTENLIKSLFKSFKSKLFGIRFIDDENHLKAVEYMVNNINPKEKLMELVIKEISETDGEQTLTANYSQLHEVIMRYPLEGKMTNINVLLTKLGFAEATNLCIFDGEEEEKGLNKINIIKNKPEPTYLEKEAQEISKMPVKLIKDLKDDNKILCKVTNALSPSEIWIQDIVDSNSLYPKFQKELNERYIQLLKNEPLVREEWKNGDLCVLKRKGKLDYYRAKIIQKFPNGVFKLVCLDTGNYESGKASEMFELIDEYREKPSFKAKKCCLIGVQPTGTSNGVWSSLARNYTTETLNDNFVHVSFKSDKKDDDSYDTVIYVDASNKTNNASNGSDPVYIRFAEMLNSKGLAFLTEKKIPLENLLAKNSAYKNTSTVVDPYDMQTYLDAKIPMEISKDKLKSIEKNYNCVVTNVDPLTEIIYIRFLTPYQSYEPTQKIQSELKGYYESNQPEYYTSHFIKDSLKKNIRLACVCKLDLEEFYRCEIIEECKQKDDCSKKKYRVVAVDFGFIRKVSQDDLYRPLVSHLSIERQAYRFKLTPNLVKYSTKNISYFLMNVLKNKYVSIEINNIDNENQSTMIGDLNIRSLNLWTSDFLTNYKTLNESLFEQDFPRYKPFHTPINMFFPTQTFTSHIEDYNMVWVQTNLKDIEEMCDFFRDQFASYSIKNLSLEKLEENRQCLCRYTNDGNLYRGQILSVNYFTSTAKVQYVDFGNSEEIKFLEIYELDEKYSQIPKLAVKCRLKNVYLDETGIEDINQYKQDVMIEMNECLQLSNENYYAVFTKANTQQNEYDVEIYINNPQEGSTAYLAYQSLIDRGRIEIRDN